MKKLIVVLLAFCILIFSACNKNPMAPITGVASVGVISTGVNPPLPPTVTLTSVGITPQNQSVFTGATLQYSATTTWSDGGQYAIVKAYDTSNHGVATINSSGLLTGVSAGTAIVSVVAGALSASTNVTVSAVTVTAVDITPKNSSITIGGNIQYATAVTWSDAQQHPVTKTYDTSNHGIATIDGNGLLTAASAGTAVVSVVAGGKSSATNVTVTVSGYTYMLVVTSSSGNITFNAALHVYTDHTLNPYITSASSPYQWNSTNLVTFNTIFFEVNNPSDNVTVTLFYNGVPVAGDTNISVPKNGDVYGLY